MCPRAPRSRSHWNRFGPTHCAAKRRVRFPFASAAAARLELLDVAGRRIAVREVGTLGPGFHSVSFRTAIGLHPGLYMVRLTQGTRTQVRRLVVLE